MSKIALTGNALGSGTLTLAAPNTNTDRTLTLPDEAGTVLTSASDVAQKGVPAFSVTRAATQSISNATWTKLQFTDEVFDTANCFDNSTNYRFTPTVAGYYQTNWSLIIESLSASTEYIVALYKNGSNYSWATNLTATSAHYNSVSSSDLVYLNGSSDYIELYVYHNYGSARNAFPNNPAFASRFSSSLVMAA